MTVVHRAAEVSYDWKEIMERPRRVFWCLVQNAAMLRDAPFTTQTPIMFDLEDAVSLKEKDSARVCLHFALKTLTTAM